MKGQSTSTTRSLLMLKMTNGLGEEIQTLPKELQQIFLDDLVTAFENRLKVLKRTQSTVTFEMAENAEYETFQT
jgi:hypothetical protein